MSKFEKKFGKYAIRNISLVLIVCYAVGYMLELVIPSIVDYLTLDPFAILFRGQIWRLVTWILIPPPAGNIFFTIIMLLFYYNIGTTLERTWGTYRYNVYLIGGMIFTVMGSFAAMGIVWLMKGGMDAVSLSMFCRVGSYLFSTYYINMSIFLAFAATYPDSQVLLMFVIPVKMKWMGIAYAVLLVIQTIQGAGGGAMDVFYRTAIVASLLNFIIFWISSKNRLHMTPKQMKRRQQFKSEVKRSARVTRHKCAICGRTEEDDPSLEFRFCSKCNGNYEYCQYHLFTHEHVK